MFSWTHALVGIGGMALMYLMKVLKDKIWPDKETSTSTPSVVVNVNIQTADKVTVDHATVEHDKKQLLKG